ncbi:MAG TPA: ABC transporter ATP-binding protein [Chitinophagaceae bacterium]|nr:ABC transporter ATP-binding protein [Chitinophagaceae bacterium]
MKHLRALNKYFWKYKLRLTIGVCFVVISNYFTVLAPQVMGFIVDYVQRQLPNYKGRNGTDSYDVMVQAFISKIQQFNFSVSSVVALSGLTILILALMRGLFMFLMRQTIIVMSRLIEYDQKNEVFKHYQQLDTAFFKVHSTGDLMSRMAEDVSRVRMFTGPAIMYLVNLISLISLSVFFMFRRDVQLTLYVLAPLPLLAATIYLVNTIIHKKSEALQSTLAALTTNAQQSYSGIRVIKSFAQEDAMLSFFDENSNKYKKAAVNLAKLEALYFPSMNLFIGLSTLLTVMIGGYYYINGLHNVGIDTLVEFVIYINMLTFPVSAIGWTASMIQRAAASQKRLNEFLQTTPSVKSKELAEQHSLSGNIQFKHVNFIYPHTNIHAIKDFTLTLEPGQKIAIVGRTGSGKSTIAQLLLRMYDVGSGTITVDGKDIKDIDISVLREQISYVPQDGFLFSDTIENNIAFGALSIDNDKIKEAAHLAVVDAEIEGFPEKYATIVGERGVTLSGGQKQRVSIARALMKEAPVIILDDALSAVDAKTEKQILQHLNRFFQNKTAIVITHRIFSLLHFDRIIVIEDGRIAEEGGHEQLMKNNGIYAEMYARQLQNDDKNLANLAVEKT